MPWATSPYANGVYLQHVIGSTWRANNYAVTKEKVLHLVSRQSKFFGDCSSLVPVLLYRNTVVHDDKSNKMTDRFNLNEWFQRYQYTVQRYQIAPHNIYNVSAKNLPFQDPGCKGARPAQLAQQLEWVPRQSALATLVECICADGTAAMDPFFIFRGHSPLFQTWMNATMHNMAPKHVYSPSMFHYDESVSWFPQRPGKHWLRRFMDQTERKCGPTRDYRLLLVDSNLGQCSIKMAEHATANKIILLYTPPWSRTYPVQPISDMFSRIYEARLPSPSYGETFVPQTSDEAEEFPMPSKFYSHLIKCAERSRLHIDKAWKASGLHPYDPSQLMHLVE